MATALAFEAADQQLPSGEDTCWDDVYEQMLVASLCLFAKDVLGLEIGPHMVEWGNLVENHDRVAINAARDHSKTTFFSYAYPIWRAWAEPGCQIYVFSATLDGSISFLEDIVYGNGESLKGLVNIPMLEHLVPHKGDFARDPKVRLQRQDVRLTNGSRIRAVGYGKKIRGRHPKYIVLDDVLNDEDMYSETTRRKKIEYYRSAITNMASPGGQIIAVGTPFHAGDLWGWLRKNPEYVFKRYPGIYKDRHGNERALFPWRWPLDQLRRKKREIGPVAFTREILCQPISDDLSIFPSQLWPPLRDETLTLRPSLQEIKERQLSCFAGVDIALSANVGSDYFVVFVVGVDPLGNHYVVDIVRRHGWGFQEQLRLIEETCRRYDVELCFIESNQAQRVWSDEMKRSTDVPVKEFFTTAQNKYPLDRGLPSLRMLIENGKMVIPYGDAYSIEKCDIWMEEGIQFGFVDGKLQGAGDYDDTIMAWWMAEEAAKQGGFSFAMGSEKEDDEALAEMMGEDGGEGGEDWKEVMIGTTETETEEVDPDSVLDGFGT